MKACGADRPVIKTIFPFSLERQWPRGNKIRLKLYLQRDSATQTSSDSEGSVHYLCRVTELSERKPQQISRLIRLCAGKRLLMLNCKITLSFRGVKPAKKTI